MRTLRTKWIALAAAVPALVCLAPLARSSDHQDGPQAIADISADITDLFAWTSPDGKSVELVLDVIPFATPQNFFGTNVQYVIHTTSRATMTSAPSSSVDLLCTFDLAQTVQCWLGDAEYVTGDPSQPSGVTSADGKLQVFAGRRDDPAFWNRDGFRAAATAVKTSFGALPKDGAGCQTLLGPQSAQMLTLLKTDGQGNPPKDAFAKANVLAIVAHVDKTLLTANGPIVGVWASTRRAP